MAQSPRAQGPAHQQHEQRHHAESPATAVPAAIPAATPADTLPGNSNRANAKEVPATSNAEEGPGIPQDLLDSINSLDKIDVLKSDKAANNKSATGDRRGSADKTFDDLVSKKAVEGQQRPKSSRVRDQRQQQQQQAAVTPARSDTRESASDAGHSDHDQLGGVDYDDFDEEDDEFRPNQASSAKGAAAGRGAKRGPAAAAAPPRGGRGRARGAKGGGGLRNRAKYKPIDTKQLEKVQKKVAGTDYDFDDEFDDFGPSERNSEPLSLQELREKTKREAAELDTKKDVKDEKPGGDEFSFDDVAPEEKAKPKKPVKKISVKVLPPKAEAETEQPAAVPAAPKGRGRPPKRPGRPKKNAVAVAEEEPEPEMPAEPPPEEKKIAPMKLGLMMKKAKSLEQTTKKDPPLPPLPIKKLKIKFGPDGHDVTVSQKEEKKTEPVSENKSAPETEDEKPPLDTVTVAKEAVGEDEESKKEQTSSTAEVEAAAAAVDETSEKKTASSPSSPMKKGSRIDFLASKLGAMKQASPPKQSAAATTTTTSSSASSIHDAIFGPSVPVNMSKSVPESSSASDTATAAKDDNSKSELERMQEEIDRMNNDPPKESFKDPRKKALKYLKGSVDRQQTTTPPMGDAASMNPGLSANAAAPAPSMGMKNFKKALLNKFSGGDIYPAVNNGPVAAPPLPTVPVPSIPEPTPTVTWRKAVDSVTSVPTRADYQWQLEEHQERKRKRDKGLEGSLPDSKANEKGGKKKKGKRDKEDVDYKPKSAAIAEAEAGKKSSSGSNGPGKGRTRGKPPKKCLADDADDDTGGDMKAENMKFAEAVRASFAAADSEKGSSGNGGRGRGKKRKQVEQPETPAAVKKTPKIVIKFAKGNSSNSNTPPPPHPPNSTKEDKEAKNNGGISEYDFADDGINVDGNMDVATSEGGKGTKLKFKMPQKV